MDIVISHRIGMSSDCAQGRVVSDVRTKVLRGRLFNYIGYRESH